MKPVLRRAHRIIAGHIRAHGFPPGIRELSQMLGCSAGSVVNYLRALELEGKIRVERGKKRAIKVIVDPDERFEYIPIRRCWCGTEFFGEEHGHPAEQEEGR